MENVQHYSSKDKGCILINKVNLVGRLIVINIWSTILLIKIGEPERFTSLLCEPTKSLRVRSTQMMTIKQAYPSKKKIIRFAEFESKILYCVFEFEWKTFFWEKLSFQSNILIIFNFAQLKNLLVQFMGSQNSRKQILIVISIYFFIGIHQKLSYWETSPNN